MAIDLVKIEGLATELVAMANQFVDAVRLVNLGMIQTEPLTATQKSNIKNRAKTALDEIKSRVDAIKAEISA